MRRIDELEGIRGLMAWWVVLGHLAFTFSDRLGELSHNRSAVDVFIVLSGFVIMFLLDNKQEHYPAFLTRRFLRLYPAYLVVLLLSAATLGMQADALAATPFEGARNALRLDLARRADEALVPHLLAHLTMLHGLVPTSALPNADLSIVGQAWSVSVEWQFYILAPAVYRGLMSGTAGRAMVAALALALFVGQFTPALRGNSAFIGPSVPWFAIGVGSYFLWKHRALKGLWALALISLIAGGVLRQPGAVVWSGVVLLLAQAPGTACVRRLLASKPLQALGRVSYSTYLVHMLPMYAAMFLLKGKAAGAPYVVGLTAMTVVGTVALSCAMYAWVEAPGIRAGSDLSRRMQRLGSAQRIQDAKEPGAAS